MTEKSEEMTDQFFCQQCDYGGKDKPCTCLLGAQIQRWYIQPMRKEIDTLRAENEKLKERVGCDHLDVPYRKLLADRDALEFRVTDLLSENENLRKQKDLYLELISDTNCLRCRAATDVAVEIHSDHECQSTFGGECCELSVKARIDKRMEELKAGQ